MNAIATRSLSSHLASLEMEAIVILREAAASFERPVLMYSIGKDSSVLLHLCRKAFYPAKIPFPALHIDTTWKFREIAFRDRMAAELKFELLVHTNHKAVADGVHPIRSGSAVYTREMKTIALREALDLHRFDAAIGGARRDEEPSRSKERIFSVRGPNHSWDPRRQRPELWHLYNPQIAPDETMRVFPLSNWTELDVWEYILAENIPVVPLYYAKERPVVERSGSLIMVDDERLELAPGEAPQQTLIRFRSLGCYPLSAAVRSDASNIEEIVEEVRSTRMSERAGRLIDVDETASMERKKREGFLMRAPITERDHLRFLACGAVDDGKSTLIGRLMAETGSIPDDQMANLVQLSRKFGTTGDELDYALLLDGLEAEREQGITIDVAYRYFGTAKRAFIVADTPGHEQYTRNMVTGASNAEFALLLVDAKAGLTRQTLRHARILSLLGIRRLLLAVNKMDLVNFRESAFAAIRDEFSNFVATLGFDHAEAIPIVARDGDNIVQASEQMPWYFGQTVLQHLETVPILHRLVEQPARFHVQSVTRLPNGARGYAGYLSTGLLEQGAAIAVARSGRTSRIERIHVYPATRPEIEAGQAATLELADQVDVGRGDILAPVEAKPELADQFAAHIVWLDEQPMLPGRTYSLKAGTHTVAATVTTLKYATDIESGEHNAANRLAINDIGFCNLSTTEPIAFDPYAQNRETGAFILIDRETGATAGAGMLAFPLYRASNLVKQSYEIDKGFRARMKGQKPAVVWFTGLPSAGKSTILNLVEQKLSQRGIHTYALDGDNLRLGLNRDLGFTEADRVENVRRAGEVARLMADAGLVVLCAFVSPFRNERRSVRERQEAGEFIEVFVDTPLAICETRDPKGLYAKARAGKAFHVTGIDSPYEPPQQPEVHLRTDTATPEAMAKQVIETLVQRFDPALNRQARPAIDRYELYFTTQP